ncbi:hypothetical protein BGZ94_003501 [Podila epigama]|nr:hypothetical protein BGZ94_003501 [Podila epigama]
MVPSPMDTAATSSATFSSCQQSASDSFSLLTHPAIVYASEKLSDPEYTARFHTVNVFDFDHTLFQSPLPNPALWDPSFIGILISWNHCHTGWWHNPGTLDLGPGAEASVWEGWWNDDIVHQVELSVKDPGCLTILLTGRNGPLYGDRLISMMRAKHLDFDIIATKPTTVARVEGVAKETYLKVHTFNTKHDFLYNVLYEYPAINAMCLWDDRPGQIAKFHEAGQEWLDKGMLERFKVKVVQEPHIYMDPKREIELVFAMVEANNRQADAEAAGGRPLIAGVGPMPRTRPELKDRGIWDPYELYSPLKRNKITIAKVPRYTGVLFSEKIQAFLRNLAPSQPGSISQHPHIHRPSALRNRNQNTWVVPEDFHVVLCPGAAPPEFHESIGCLGATILVELEAVGALEERAWAIKVKEFPLQGSNCTIDTSNTSSLCIVSPDGQIFSSVETFMEHARSLSSNAAPPTTVQKGHPLNETLRATIDLDLDRLGHLKMLKGGVPLVTMAYDHRQGARAVDSSSITNWELITSLDEKSAPCRIVLVGTIGEKRLYGMKQRTYKVDRAEVSIAKVIMNTSSGHVVQGRELGEMIRKVQVDMEKHGVENKLENLTRITDIARDVLSHCQASKVVSR